METTLNKIAAETVTEIEFVVDKHGLFDYSFTANVGIKVGNKVGNIIIYTRNANGDNEETVISDKEFTQIKDIVEIDYASIIEKYNILLPAKKAQQEIQIQEATRKRYNELWYVQEIQRLGVSELQGVRIELESEESFVNRKPESYTKPNLMVSYLDNTYYLHPTTVGERYAQKTVYQVSSGHGIERTYNGPSLVKTIEYIKKKCDEKNAETIRTNLAKQNKLSEAETTRLYLETVLELRVTYNQETRAERGYTRNTQYYTVDTYTAKVNNQDIKVSKSSDTELWIGGIKCTNEQAKQIINVLIG